MLYAAVDVTLGFSRETKPIGYVQRGREKRVCEDKDLFM